MKAPIPHILLALEGKIESMGGGSEPEPEKPTPDEVANKIRQSMAFFRGE